MKTPVVETIESTSRSVAGTVPWRTAAYPARARRGRADVMLVDEAAGASDRFIALDRFDAGVFRHLGLQRTLPG
jgi:hypothetical protein